MTCRGATLFLLVTACFSGACIVRVEPVQLGGAGVFAPMAEAEVRVLDALPAEDASRAVWRVRYRAPTPPGYVEQRTADYRAQAARAGANVLVRAPRRARRSASRCTAPAARR